MLVPFTWVRINIGVTKYKSVNVSKNVLYVYPVNGMIVPVLHNDFSFGKLLPGAKLYKKNILIAVTKNTDAI